MAAAMPSPIRPLTAADPRPSLTGPTAKPEAHTLAKLVLGKSGGLLAALVENAGSAGDAEERRERSDAAARSNSEQRKREYVESAPHERLAALQSVIQTAISEDWEHHACASGATRLEDSPLSAQTYRPNSPAEHSVTVPSVRSSQWASGKGQASTWLPSISLSADMAQLQLRGVRGPHEQRMAAAKLKCMELETAHALEKETHHGSTEGESPPIARGLVLLVEGQVSRYRTQVEQLTNDVHELGLQRDHMGQSDKDTRAASNAIKAKLRLSFSKRQH
ncbi:hypothetical protein QJQ45_008997 [Haematococcus lacustris]|nr:hypothetical protein QJQ45_008997 [Haematococcus lacustris]